MSKSITSADVSDKKVLVRVDFNVPIENGKITDDTRIRAAQPTIDYLLKNNAAIILMSHMGRPKGKIVPEMSLEPVADYLRQLYPNATVIMAADATGPDAKTKAMNLQSGEILLLENLRFHSEEEAGDENFAYDLASLGDIYVNDAFGTAHRAHASTTIIANSFPGKSYFGKLMQDEIDSIGNVLKNYQKPFTAIIGGAKVSDKVGIIKNLMDKADNIIIGGAMAYTFIKARGGNVGKSRVEEEKLDLAKEIMQEATEKGINLMLPADSKCATEFSNDAESKVFPSDEIPADYMGLDIADEAISDFSAAIMKSKTILWNGPMGVFEWSNYEKGTRGIAYAVAEATQNNNAYSLIGGGDSVAAINKFNLNDKVSYVSTGGGAMLEFLEGKVLPGIEVIQKES